MAVAAGDVQDEEDGMKIRKRDSRMRLNGRCRRSLVLSVVDYAFDMDPGVYMVIVNSMGMTLRCAA